MVEPKTIILTAGRGSRMYPFTLYWPIALCTVANVSLLERLLTQIQRAGLHHATLAFPSRAFALADLAKAASPLNFHLDVFSPQTPLLGQVGNVREAVADFDGPILVVYGDSFLAADFCKLISAHEENRSRGALATIFYHRPPDLRVVEQDGRTYHGVMSVNSDGLITRFQEKPKVVDIFQGFDLANAAVFILESHVLHDSTFKSAQNFSYEIFEPAVHNRLPLYGCDMRPGFRFDAGRIDRWHELNMKVLKKEIDSDIPGKEIAASVWVGKETAVSNARVEAPVLLGDAVKVGLNTTLGPELIIGNHCVISDGAALRRCVIMENCLIGPSAEVDSCLIGPHSTIAAGVRLPKYSVLGAYSVVGSSGFRISATWSE